MGSCSTPAAAYLVAVTSPITLPIVRKMSGKVSTATSSPKGATGTPIDTAIGAIEVTKLIEPGRLTDESAAAIATARPIAISQGVSRSEEQTSELKSLMRLSYAVFCLKKKK